MTRRQVEEGVYVLEVALSSLKNTRLKYGPQTPTYESMINEWYAEHLRILQRLARLARKQVRRGK